MEGQVNNFLTVKNYGYIDGADGQSYFVHISDVCDSQPLVPGQQVVFDPTSTPKGLRARSVVPGIRPQAIYVKPNGFIIKRALTIPGHEIIRRIAHLYGEMDNSPDQARENLRREAWRRGANAIIGYNLNKFTESDGNYCYSVHEAYGDAVVAMKVEYTTDPYRIAMSEVTVNTYLKLGKH